MVEAVRLEVGEAPVSLAEVGCLADAGVVRGDRALVVADGLQDVAEAEQRADVCGAELEAAPVRLDRLRRERGARERGRAHEMRLRQRVIDRERAVEAVQRLAVAVLLLEELPEVEQREQ